MVGCIRSNGPEEQGEESTCATAIVNLDMTMTRMKISCIMHHASSIMLFIMNIHYSVACNGFRMAWALQYRGPPVL